MNPWLTLVVVWIALAVPAAVVVGAAMRRARREYLRQRAERCDASWWDCSR